MREFRSTFAYLSPTEAGVGDPTFYYGHPVPAELDHEEEADLGNALVSNMVYCRYVIDPEQHGGEGVFLCQYVSGLFALGDLYPGCFRSGRARDTLGIIQPFTSEVCVEAFLTGIKTPHHPDIMTPQRRATFLRLFRLLTGRVHPQEPTRPGTLTYRTQKRRRSIEF